MTDQDITLAQTGTQEVLRGTADPNEKKFGYTENCFFLYGTVPNKQVAGNSHLCEDLLQQFIQKS